MDSNISYEAKKVNLEELSKEDLIKRCKSLLAIAQKAKQAKDISQEEKNKLQQQLTIKIATANDATQELVEKLTQQKLTLVTTVEDLKTQNSSLDSKLQIFEKELHVCQEKLYTSDNENVSYKRQVSRLTDENEQLLTHLETLEKQIDELNKVGIQQREQLLELESKAKEAKAVVDDSKLAELQRMLSVSLEEIKKLKTENVHLNEKVKNLQISSSEKDKNIIVISEELQSKCDVLHKVMEELNELKKTKEETNKIAKDHDELTQLYNELREDVELRRSNSATQEKLKENIKELHNLNDRLKEKVKLYHSKIIKFAGNAKALKEEKNEILQLFRLYTDQVKEWKEQLHEAGQKLATHVSSIESENKTLKEDINILRKEYSTTSLENDNRLVEEKSIIEKKLNEAITSYENQIDIIRRENENKLKEVEIQYSNKIETIEKSINEYRSQLEVLNMEKESNNKELVIQKSAYVELTNEVESVKEEKQRINMELVELTNRLKSLSEEKEVVTKDLVIEKDANVELISEIKLMKEENVEFQNKLEECEVKCSNLNNKIENLVKANKEAKDEIYSLLSEKKSVNIIMKEKEVTHQKQGKENQDKLLDYEKQVNDLKAHLKMFEDNMEHIEATEKQLAERSCEEIKKLAQENKNLTDLNNVLQEKLEELQQKRLNVFHADCQTEGDMTPSNELEEQIINLKRENAELLSEMNEMNQAIKERGEIISKLEAHCEEVMKKLQIYEAQANKNVNSITEKEEIIRNLTREIETLKLDKNSDLNLNQQASADEINCLKNEIEVLREKLNSNLDVSYAESETMSTSTISRTEDLNRLKDLEGSWEEKYGKLRNLAVKLKGKVRELTNTLTKEQAEKDDLQKKIATNLKTIHSLQNQSDKLEDELETAKKDCKQYLNRLNTIAEDISRDKQSLVSKDDAISELTKELEGFKTEKQTMENWKKQVSAKVQTLRKELETNNMLRKELEGKVSKFTADLEAKEQALKSEVESHKQTKNLLDLSNNECKKNSVLSLEMQDYERSVKETSKKLEKHQEQISKLKGQVDSQKSTINALREQNKLLEQRDKEVQGDLSAATVEINTYKKKVAQLEEEIQQKEDKIQSITQLLENSRSENEELSTELSKVIAEHQKANNILKSERDLLRSQTMGLQQNLREVQDTLKLKEDEMKIVQSEYEGYKVRAQSVLRQNQSRDVGLEEKLSEEMTSLKVETSRLSKELEKNIEKLKELEETNEKLLVEKVEGLKRIEELEIESDELKNQYAQLSAKHQKTLSEHAETVRSLKVHADTLSQCYRQQITELETRHLKELTDLQSRMEKAPSPVEIPPVPPTMTREEGEGSESIESNNAPNVHPVPLERLLGSDTDQEVVFLKKQLNEQESKVAHLTALLSDTEQDLAKHAQMNKLLKEEIRRQQRSVEREKHAENLEYLKNVVFKFVTLNSGDERTRLVPVLNTILKLSPEETQKLNMVAKGDTGIKGWTNYLPTWSSSSKP